MSENYENTQVEVSAPQKVLKLLLRVFNQIKYFAGLLLIDNWMRRIMAWYDLRHPNPTPRRKKYDNSRVKALQKEILFLNEECDRLEGEVSKEKETISTLHQNQEEAKRKYQTLQQEIEQYQKEALIIQSEKLGMERDLEKLKGEITRLLGKCIPDTEIPAMIYYGTGDAQGLNIRKVTVVASDTSTYRLTTFQGDSSKAYFEPILGSHTKDVIANRNVTLLACEIVSIAANPSSIEVIEPGEAVKENNKWRVVKKSKVKIV